MNLKFVQFYSIFAFVYSIFLFARVSIELMNGIIAAKVGDGHFEDNDINNGIFGNSLSTSKFESLFSQLDDVIKTQTEPVIKYKYYESIAHFMEILAHSCKLCIYGCISVHLRFFCTRRK